MTAPSSIHLFPQLQDNYAYILVCHLTGESAIVDCADAEPILAWFDREGKTPSAILITHHHADHIAGNHDLLARWPNLPVFGPAYDRHRIPNLTKLLHDGDQFSIGLQKALVLHLPGHTSGHIAFFFPDASALFCGDTLFAAGCGRLFEGSPEEMHASLQRLSHLPPETQIFCGHEYTLSNLKFALSLEPDNPMLQARFRACQTLRDKGQATLPSTLSEELHTNPFLRLSQPPILAAASSQGADPLLPSSLFAAIRKLKDHFVA